MKMAVLLLVTLSLVGCGKPNEAYVSDVQKQLGPILEANINKDEVVTFLKKYNYKIHEVSKSECVESRQGDVVIKCNYPLYIHTRLPIEKLFSLTESGAHRYFFFNTTGNLLEHKIQIMHTGL